MFYVSMDLLEVYTSYPHLPIFLLLAFFILKLNRRGRIARRRSFCPLPLTTSHD